jgi:hypothetical protein
MKKTIWSRPLRLQLKDLVITSIFGETCSEDATTWRILMTLWAAAQLTGLQEPPQLKIHSKNSAQGQTILQKYKVFETSPDNCKEFVRGRGQIPKRQAAFRSSSTFILEEL